MPTPKPHHARAKSGVPNSEPVLQGWIARESSIVDKLLNRRYATAYPGVLVTYRKEGDESPSKVWPLRGVALTEVAARHYHLRHANTSTLWAVARGAYDRVEMWGFALSWPVGVPERLSLAFETRQQAERWRAALEAAAAAGLAPARAQAPPGSGGTRSDGSFADGGAPAAARAESGALRARGSGAAPLADEPAAGPPARSRCWASVMHINGIAVYVEEQEDDADGGDAGGGAVMVSAVVRAPPDDVFRQLTAVRRSEGLGVFTGARTVEEVDPATHVVAQTWRGAGLVGSLCAPREMVLLRTWRRDEDGTYVVLFQSTRHPAARESRGWGWRTPVRVRVAACGFTVAPLRPRYAAAAAAGGASAECLVTLVLKADLGGLLSEGSAVGRWSLLGPVGCRSMLEPVVMSVVVLRDSVEQARFVVRPLSQLAGDREPAAGAASDDEAAAAGGGAGPARALRHRTATMLAYRRPPQEAAPGARRGAGGAAAAAVRTAYHPAGEPSPPATPTSAAAAAAGGGDDWALAGTLPQRYWSCPGAAGFRVRGPSYLADRKKVAAAPPMFELASVDLLELEEPMAHVARHLPSVRRSAAPFVFVVQLMVPSSPPLALVCSWAAPMPVLGASVAELTLAFEREQGAVPESVAAFFRVFSEFLEGDGADADRRRNTQFKLIPNVAHGPWIVRQSVGTTPVLLGQKLTTKYFRGERYFEVDVDIGASSVAASITNLVAGATKSLCLDLAVLVEGQQQPHLPEQLLGTVRLERLDLKQAAWLDETGGGRVVRPGDVPGFSGK